LAHSITYTPTFKRGFKSLSSQDQVRVARAIEDLSKAEDPRVLGLKKRGQLSNVYAYEVGQRIRLLYDFSNDQLILIGSGLMIQFTVEKNDYSNAMIGD
jgi:mRNA-degrading endonuclease RelE of RelBE toxin-antitoxin system